MSNKQEIINSIISRANAPLISRKEAARLSGGLVSEKTLANLDSLNEGPRERIRIGRRVGYPVEVFAAWFAMQIEAV